MGGETDLRKMLKNLEPIHNEGEYVFCRIDKLDHADVSKILFFFKEQEGYTVVLEKKLADSYHLKYVFVASWITLKVHSSLEAVGLTAAFSSALAKADVSCNVVAAVFHDHIFVNVSDVTKTMKILNRLSGGDII
jgi:hypothetical protein